MKRPKTWKNVIIYVKNVQKYQQISSRPTQSENEWKVTDYEKIQ